MLGLIPGVGAMYNGQFFKGFIHVIVFAALISISDHYSIFGIFIAAWVLYQSFEAFHTAKALRDGQPAPDPLGLNEVGNWLNMSWRPPNAGQPGSGEDQAAPPPPICWGRREPVGAIVLIALGLLFLLGQLNIFNGRFFEFAWPLMLIALGVWLIVRRIGDSQGGCK
jgi:hypothetical protein